MNAVIYARYSSDNQREESIEGQLRDCREYAEQNKLAIVGNYIDRALSARTADRPDFQRMITTTNVSKPSMGIPANGKHSSGIGWNGRWLWRL